MSAILNTGLGHLAGSKIEIMISCTNLADLDDFTKSDPMCVLFVRQFGQWKEYARTEAIRNTLNPKVWSISQCISSNSLKYNVVCKWFLKILNQLIEILIFRLIY